jgi:hypothetical protein
MTMDIDMLGRTPNSVDNLVEIIRQCLAVETPDDGVNFDTKSVKGDPITLDKKYHGVRIRVYGRLGNARLSLQLDFGFGDVVVPGPVEIEYPELLDFGKPHLFGYTPESAIAEKFQAMVELDMANSGLASADPADDRLPLRRHGHRSSNILGRKPAFDRRRIAGRLLSGAARGERRSDGSAAFRIAPAS